MKRGIETEVVRIVNSSGREIRTVEYDDEPNVFYERVNRLSFNGPFRKDDPRFSIALPFITLHAVEVAARRMAAESEEHAIMPRLSVMDTPVNVFVYCYSDGSHGPATVHYSPGVYEPCCVGKNS